MKMKVVMFFFLGITLAAGGCGGSGGTPESASGGPSLALLGSIAEEDRQHLEASGITLYRYDNETSVDHPAFLIAEGGWDEISSTPALMEELSDAYTDGRGRWGRIVLFRPTNEDIDRLSALQGHPFDADIHAEDSVLFYGIGKHLDAERMIYVGVESDKLPGEYEVIEEAVSDDQPTQEGAADPSDSLARACADFSDWLLLEEVSQDLTSAAAAGTRAADGKNLLDLASKFHVRLTSTAHGKTFSINHYIVSVHHFSDERNTSGGMDWYYVQQEDILNGGSGYAFHYQSAYYKSLVNNAKYWVGGAYVADKLIENYRIANALGTGAVNQSEIVLSQPKPQAINNVITHTETQGYNFGAEVGGGYSSKEGASGGGKLTFGYNCSDSKTYNTRDVTAVQYTTGVSPEWQYDFRMPSRHSSPQWWKLNEGALLGHSTYTPWQMWAWGIPTKHRGAVKSFIVSFTPTIAGVYSRNSGSIDPRTVRSAPTTNLTVSLPQPPLLALENNSFVYDRNAGAQHLRIAAQGGWTHSVTEGGDWITATQSPGRLDIQVKENATGESRAGNIRIARNGSGGDTAEIAVTQLR